MPEAAPLVSIGLPVFNGEALIGRALESLLTQDFRDFEIIVCDNASQDATVQIAAAYADRDGRIRLYRNPQNLGLAGNFNRTFELSRGRYFKWAAHDDWHAPESLRVTVQAMEENPAATLCTTGVSVVDEHGAEFDRWVQPADLTGPEPHRRMHQLLLTLGETHPMYGLISASALAQTQLIQGYVGSDRTLLSELSLLGPFVDVPEILHFYTVSASARRNYRPSVYYDPRNRGKLPLRTWRLIYEHLDLVRRSDLKAHQKLFLVRSVLGRFGIRDFRRLAAETYHAGRYLTARARATGWGARTAG
jgi:glycosyltransferase involved in cell wall biosynthesis